MTITDILILNGKNLLVRKEINLKKFRIKF